MLQLQDNLLWFRSPAVASSSQWPYRPRVPDKQVMLNSLVIGSASRLIISSINSIIISETVASGAATASADEDDGQSGFDDFTTTAYTNGGNSSAMSVHKHILSLHYNRIH